MVLTHVVSLHSSFLLPWGGGGGVGALCQDDPFPVEQPSQRYATFYESDKIVALLYQTNLSWSLLECMLSLQMHFTCKEVYGLTPNNPVLSTPFYTEPSTLLLNRIHSIQPLGLSGCCPNPSRYVSRGQSYKWEKGVLIQFNDFLVYYHSEWTPMYTPAIMSNSQP